MDRVPEPPSGPIARRREHSIKTIPSNDRVFAELAEATLGELLAASPRTEPSTAALERALRRIFPRTVVHAADVSGTQEIVWYAYREGRWVPPSPAPWWRDAALPRIVLDTAGFVVDANGPAEQFVGEGGDPLVGRHFTDFAREGTLREAIALYEAYRATAGVAGTMRFRTAAGRLRSAEVHVEPTPTDGLAVTLRPAHPAPPSEHLPKGEPVSIELSCEPEEDELFGRYARVVLARMPEPTPGGLGLRLRRVYPKATVEAERLGRWRCRRDALERAPEGWWRDRALAEVVFDARSTILAANETACALAGLALVGHSWHELAVPGALPEADLALAALRDLGCATTAWQVLAASGDVIEFDCHLELLDGEGPERVRAVCRPRPAATGRR